jgi:hypothetical protein
MTKRKVPTYGQEKAVQVVHHLVDELRVFAKVRITVKCLYLLQPINTFCKDPQLWEIKPVKASNAFSCSIPAGRLSTNL